MKILILLLMILFFCQTKIIYANTEITEGVDSTNFSLRVSDITYYKKIKKTEFFINLENITNPQNIAYWKVRTYCDEKMNLQLTASSTDDCNKVIRFDSLSNDMFSLLFKNRTPQSKDFSIKVKAYDKYGKGLHGEKKGFGWK